VPTKKMPFKIRKPKAVPYLRTLLLGQPKIGKTSFVGTTNVKTLVIDFEGGDVVLPHNNLIDVVDGTSSEVYNDVIQYLRTSDHDYKMVVVDSLSAVNAKFFQEIREYETARSDRRENVHRPELSDWNLLQNQMEAMMTGVFGLALHVLMTAHTLRQQSNLYGNILVPFLQPTKMPIRALAVFNEVVYLAMNAKTSQRFLILDKSPKNSVGCRVKEGVVLPEQIADPTFEKYFAALRGEYVQITEGLVIGEPNIEHDD